MTADPPTTLRANALRVSITPTVALDQGSGASASDIDVSGTVDEPLEVTFLALWADGDDDPVIIVSLDTLYPGPEVRAAIEGAAELPTSRVLVAASHTHRAPMTDPHKPLLGHTDPEYMARLTEAIQSGVRSVLDRSSATPVYVDVAEGRASHSINRRRNVRLHIGRRVRTNVMTLAPNPSGAVDETVLLATLTTPEGVALAHIWNYACHPVAHPAPGVYSSHYVDHVRRRLRAEQNDHDLPVVFLQGFSGNTRPRASVGHRGVRQLVRRILSGPQFRAAMKPRRYSAWADSLADVVLGLRSRQSRLDIDEIITSRLRRPGSEFAQGAADLSFHALRLSPEFVIVGVSAEVVAEYAPWTRALTGARYTMCVGCIDDVFGYVPTKEMIREGGYEAGEFCEAFSLVSLSPDIDEKTRSGIEQALTGLVDIHRSGE